MEWVFQLDARAIEQELKAWHRHVSRDKRGALYLAMSFVIVGGFVVTGYQPGAGRIVLAVTLVLVALAVIGSANAARRHGRMAKSMCADKVRVSQTENALVVECNGVRFDASAPAIQVLWQSRDHTLIRLGPFVTAMPTAAANELRPYQKNVRGEGRRGAADRVSLRHVAAEALRASARVLALRIVATWAAILLLWWLPVPGNGDNLASLTAWRAPDVVVLGTLGVLAALSWVGWAVFKALLGVSRGYDVQAVDIPGKGECLRLRFEGLDVTYEWRHVKRIVEDRARTSIVVGGLAVVHAGPIEWGPHRPIAMKLPGTDGRPRIESSR